MNLPTYPRPTFGPSGLGLRFGLPQRGLYIALGAPLLWAWQVGLPMSLKVIYFQSIFLIDFYLKRLIYMQKYGITNQTVMQQGIQEK